MKRIVLGLALLLVSVAAFAQQPLNVWIKASPVISQAGMVSGTTNLPDGTILHILIGAVVPSDDFNRDGCMDGDGQAAVAVSHGAFGPVLAVGGGRPCLKPGAHYVVHVVMQAPFLQPLGVIAVIGKNGENLSGPFVVGPSDDRGVEATIPVAVQ